MERVILLNADHTFLRFIDWKRSICLILKGKVEVLEATDKLISNITKTIQIAVPKVIKLLNFVKGVYKTKVTFSKRNLFIRDKKRCVYCGSPDSLTVDHVFPASRGGKTNFTNCVSACQKCNNKKGDRTPEEANMKLPYKPYVPSVSVLMKIRYTYKI